MDRNRDLRRKQVQGVNRCHYHPPLPVPPPQQLFQSQLCRLGVQSGAWWTGMPAKHWAAGLWAWLPSS